MYKTTIKIITKWSKILCVEYVCSLFDMTVTMNLVRPLEKENLVHRALNNAVLYVLAFSTPF